MAFTVSDLIADALYASGRAAVGDAISPESSEYGFRKLNDLIDLMKTERLAIYRRQRVGPFAVTAGQGDITATSPILIGVNAGVGAWVTPRPVFLDFAGVIYTAGSTPQPELPMHVFTVDEWRRQSVKGVTSTLSRALIYDRLYDANGNGAIYLYPVPSASFNVVLYVPVALDEFPLDADGNPVYSTVIALPPGYRLGLISNLAKILCIGVRTIDKDLEDLATNTMAAMKAANVVTNMDALHCDEAVRATDHRTSGFDWLTGEIR